MDLFFEMCREERYNELGLLRERHIRKTIKFLKHTDLENPNCLCGVLRDIRQLEIKRKLYEIMIRGRHIN